MIFCVEDEQNICELEVYTLQSVGMEAQGCGSGRDLSLCWKSRCRS